ncbi:hypothetical protein HMPREF9123_0598 [Neisseria bacilliformis ATCC BAA-1200]|uniref:Uncharacterized protein n=1 Tax=Neisseria bacilliformis ATCC BAA-1200 TaxID=888742 RepID=F2BA44_9NEIS|nr:hypothetical protein HMPREF9123_0598 [Neisseria bacilliformis ATCC BAA-1200]
MCLATQRLHTTQFCRLFPVTLYALTVCVLLIKFFRFYIITQNL